MPLWARRRVLQRAAVVTTRKRAVPLAVPLLAQRQGKRAFTRHHSIPNRKIEHATCCSARAHRRRENCRKATRVCPCPVRHALKAWTLFGVSGDILLGGFVVSNLGMEAAWWLGVCGPFEHLKNFHTRDAPELSTRLESKNNVPGAQNIPIRAHFRIPSHHLHDATSVARVGEFRMWRAIRVRGGEMRKTSERRGLRPAST